jgi:hypothetical protein
LVVEADCGCDVFYKDVGGKRVHCFVFVW